MGLKKFFNDVICDVDKQRMGESFDQGREMQFEQDILIFISYLQDKKINDNEIIEILYKYYEINDRRMALDFIKKTIERKEE